VTLPREVRKRSPKVVSIVAPPRENVEEVEGEEEVEQEEGEELVEEAITEL